MFGLFCPSRTNRILVWRLVNAISGRDTMLREDTEPSETWFWTRLRHCCHWHWAYVPGRLMISCVSLRIINYQIASKRQRWGDSEYQLESVSCGTRKRFHELRKLVSRLRACRVHLLQAATTRTLTQPVERQSGNLFRMRWNCEEAACSISSCP